ncbi:hypothetical protein PENTCL1PPCAC_12651, partial [Pristionchus entomophagus]
GGVAYCRSDTVPVGGTVYLAVLGAVTLLGAQPATETTQKAIFELASYEKDEDEDDGNANAEHDDQDNRQRVTHCPEGLERGTRSRGGTIHRSEEER